MQYLLPLSPLLRKSNMKNSIRIFIFVTLSCALSACGSKKDPTQLIDNPQLIATLQQQVDSLVKEGYQVEQIDIYGKTFAEHGPDAVGLLDLMAIYAAAPNPDIKPLANFSYSPIFKQLTFNGYPTNSIVKKSGKTYSFAPDLLNTIGKLDEINALIPAHYAYKQLLSVNYKIVHHQPEYLFVVEVEPESKETTHPKVTQKEVSNVTHSRSTGRRKYGRTKETYHTDVKKLMQHTMRFKLVNDIVEIQ